MRWTAKLDPGYLLAKARFVPLTDLPYYALRYFANRVYRVFSTEKRLAYWGPRLTGMSELVRRYSLDQVCALQWKRCLEAADEALSRLPRERVVRVCYEEFVDNPKNELARICGELGMPASEADLQRGVGGVSSGSVNKGRDSLDAETLDAVTPLIDETLVRFGYRFDAGD